MKKLLLGLGLMGTITLPIVTLVSCKEGQQNTTEFRYLDVYDVDYKVVQKISVSNINSWKYRRGSIYIEMYVDNKNNTDTFYYDSTNISIHLLKRDLHIVVPDKNLDLILGDVPNQYLLRETIGKWPNQIKKANNGN